jgi:hypothetical protein
MVNELQLVEQAREQHKELAAGSMAMLAAPAVEPF